jgi:hypothetical protein
MLAAISCHGGSQCNWIDVSMQTLLESPEMSVSLRDALTGAGHRLKAVWFQE